jgi:hypothetical protein
LYSLLRLLPDRLAHLNIIDTTASAASSENTIMPPDLPG